VRAALEASVASLRDRAEALVSALGDVDAVVVASVAAVGGGGAPGVELPSVAVSLPARFAAVLRTGEPAVAGRVVRDRCLLDLRTVRPEEDAKLREAVRRCG
jgi:L-seryl-tRNA(Ser) seleniumtransferase